MRRRRKRKSSYKALLALGFVFVGFCLLGAFALSKAFLSEDNQIFTKIRIFAREIGRAHV